MIQEYLLLDIAEKNRVGNYKPDKVRVRIFSSNNNECWYVQFSSDGNNEEIAKGLSKVDTYIRSNFNVKVLDSECSAYFNQHLYPLVSRFEYKLRKLLYLISTINKDEKTDEVIENIESKDFGTIFSSLFIDANFMRSLKDEIKGRNLERFTKSEILDYLSSVEEHTLWDDQIGKDVVPTLREKYNEVRAARNSVMHSQIIGWDEYLKTKKLFRSINAELDKALSDIEIYESETPSRPSFNQAFEGVMRAQTQLSAMAEALRPSIEQMQQLSNIYANNPEISRLEETLRKISSSYAISSEAKRIQELTENLRIPKMDIPPEMLRLQNGLSTLSSHNDSDDDDANNTDDTASPDNDEERLK